MEVHAEIAALQALCCAPRSTEQSTFRAEEKGEKVTRKGEEEVWPAKRAKGKRTRENRSVPNLVVSNLVVCIFFAKALFCADLRLALFCILVIALFCALLCSLRVSASARIKIWECQMNPASNCPSSSKTNLIFLALLLSLIFLSLSWLGKEVRGEKGPQDQNFKNLSSNEKF